MTQWLSIFHAHLRSGVWISGTCVSICWWWEPLVGTGHPQSQLASETSMSGNFGLYWTIHSHLVRWKSDWGWFSILISGVITHTHVSIHVHILKYVKMNTHINITIHMEKWEKKKKMWPIYIRGFYVVMKKNEVMAFAVKMIKIIMHSVDGFWPPWYCTHLVHMHLFIHMLKI